MRDDAHVLSGYVLRRLCQGVYVIAKTTLRRTSSAFLPNGGRTHSRVSDIHLQPVVVRWTNGKWRNGAASLAGSAKGSNQ